jgi:predicted nucleotidyltransferase
VNPTRRLSGLAKHRLIVLRPWNFFGRLHTVMIRLPPDFKEFLRLLNSHRVEYLLIGGYAVAYHGYPRPTGDMDIWIAVSSQNATRVMAALVEFGFRADDVPVDLFTEPGRIVRMGIPPMRLEIVTTISGVDFAFCYARRASAVVDGVAVNIIGLDDLKTNKKASGRHKDLNDLEQLP